MKRFGQGIFILLPIIYAMLIWWQSSHFDPESVSSLTYLLGPTLVKLIGIGFELMHLLEFGILYFLIILALLSLGRLSNLEEVLTFIISVLYGLLDELHQYYVPFRSTSLVDLFKDIVGILFVWYMIHRFYFREDSKIGAKLRKISNLTHKKLDM